jgi:hypothetical protein
MKSYCGFNSDMSFVWFTCTHWAKSSVRYLGEDRS